MRSVGAKHLRPSFEVGPINDGRRQRALSRAIMANAWPLLRCLQQRPRRPRDRANAFAADAAQRRLKREPADDLDPFLLPWAERALLSTHNIVGDNLVARTAAFL